jgi:hypothetical protein
MLRGPALAWSAAPEWWPIVNDLYLYANEAHFYLRNASDRWRNLVSL